MHDIRVHDIRYEAICELVRQRLSPKRWQHTEGCQALAKQLALRYKLDVGQACLAVMLHDSWRDCSKNELRDAAAGFGVEVSPLEYRHTVLLHGPVAAAWAKEELHIRDAAVLEAVRYHTTGAPGVGPLAAIIYVADALEPGRSYPEAEQLRALLPQTNLEQMVLLVIEQTLRHQLSKDEPIDPRTVLWRNELLERLGACALGDQKA